MPTTTDLNKIRIAFLERASAPNIPPIAFKLAHLIAYRYMNRRTWTAYPPQERLARDLNVSIRTVQRLTDILEPLGLTVMPGNGRGYASLYSIDPERATRVSSFPAQKGDKKRVTKTAEKGDRALSPQPSKNQDLDKECLRTPLSRGERETFACANDSSPPGGDPPADAGPRQERPQSAEVQIKPEPPVERSRPVERATERSFAALRGVWARGWPADDVPKAIALARNAYDAAIREGANPADILAGAETTVAAYAAGDGVRYLQRLPEWLAAHGWEKPPPTKPKRRRNGARQPRRKPDLAEIGFALAREYAAERAAS
jgi:hypothetical protein